MHFVYLDEFGHIGPFVSRDAPKHNESPVFGLAGMILPEEAVRPFATFFLQNKEKNFHSELKRSGKRAAKWEKKGTSFIRPEPLKKYKEARRVLLRTISKVESLGGNIFYYGREKRIGLHEDLNSIGLYTTCFAHALRKLDNYCDRRASPFVVVMDQHSARKELLECAAKTMFGSKPCLNLASPPFEVESYLNQNIQAADWIATLVGRLTAYEVAPQQYNDYEYIKKIYQRSINDNKRNSLIEKRPRREISQRADGPFAELASLQKSLNQRA